MEFLEFFDRKPPSAPGVRGPARGAALGGFITAGRRPAAAELRGGRLCQGTARWDEILGFCMVFVIINVVKTIVNQPCVNSVFLVLQSFFCG